MFFSQSKNMFKEKYISTVLLTSFRKTIFAWHFIAPPTLLEEDHKNGFIRLSVRPVCP